MVTWLCPCRTPPAVLFVRVVDESRVRTMAAELLKQRAIMEAASKPVSVFEMCSFQTSCMWNCL